MFCIKNHKRYTEINNFNCYLKILTVLNITFGWRLVEEKDYSGFKTVMAMRKILYNFLQDQSLTDKKKDNVHEESWSSTSWHIWQMLNFLGTSLFLNEVQITKLNFFRIRFSLGRDLTLHLLHRYNNSKC